MCNQHSDSTGHGKISAIVFQFAAGNDLALKVDTETDELVWDEAAALAVTSVDLITLCPLVAKAYGLSLTWCWEMKNHQGYFDAVQLELTDMTLANAVILQFKVAASSIGIFEVSSPRPQ